MPLPEGRVEPELPAPSSDPDEAMRIAVLTLTRDRLEYSRHCFQTLRDNAGCDFDWFVLDQASEDGTVDWLLSDESLDVTVLHDNVGICRGLNALLDEAVNPEHYDALVRFDNDCEVLQPDTLRTICELSVEHEAVLAPRVLGLQNPPPVFGTYQLDGYEIANAVSLGGIFMVIPATLFSQHGFRYDERNKLGAGDEAIVSWWRSKGGRCGYVTDFSVNHYETTEGQMARYPGYFARKSQEWAA